MPLIKKPERSTYTPLDFREWSQAQGLVLSPKFQRRGVWTTPARSYLIDTMLRGMPVPPIYLRVLQSGDKKRMIREVIDGQQRIAAVLDYMDGKYAISRSVGSEAAGHRFDKLDEDQRDQISQYPFICEVFYGIDDPLVLQIFARLNTYSVKLNAQELRNGKYFGQFKRTAYSLAFEHLEFWRRHRIFTENNIARMLEAELTSELLILLLDGFQDKKTTIEKFYGEYDESFPSKTALESQFRGTIDAINESLGDDLRELEFRRPPLFYTLFSAVAHRLHGIPAARIRGEGAKGRLSTDDVESLNSAARKLSEQIALARAEEPVPALYERFVAACLRQTDNLRPRVTRFEVLFAEAFVN